MNVIPADKPVRLAFLGCGFAARIHSKTLRSFGSEIEHHYASRDQARAREYNTRFHGSGFFGSYEEALNSPDIDVVFITTPPSTHLDLTVEALQKGKHVFVEKPPFLFSSDFDTVMNNQEMGCRVFVAENYFYKPVVQHLKQALSDKLIGDVLFLHINASKLQKTGDWRDRKEFSGGGALFEGGIHWINLLSNLGLTPGKVFALRTDRKKSLEKSVMVAIQYEEGPVATLIYSWETPVLLKGLHLSQVMGREGIITFETNGIFMVIRGNKKRLIFPGLKDIAGYKAMFTDFLNSLRTGESPAFTLELAKRDLALIENAYETIAQNQSH